MLATLIHMYCKNKTPLWPRNFTLFYNCGQLLPMYSMASAAASGWAGWALAHPEFWSSVNPITTRGTDYAHCNTASPPEFENLAASLY